MPDLATDLRGYLDAMVDSIDESTPPTIDLAPEQSGTPHRRRRFVLAGVAAALVAIAGWALSIDDSNDQVSTVNDPTPSTTPDSTTEGSVRASVPAGWSRIADWPGDDLRPRTGAWTGTELVVFGGDEITDAPERIGYGLVTAYDPSTDTWRILPAPPEPLRSPHSVWTGDQVVTIGLDGSSAALDPSTGDWQTLSTAPEAVQLPLAYRSSLALWLDGEVVLPVAGLALDPVADEWRTVPEPPPLWRLHDAVVFDDAIVVVGAIRESESVPAELRIYALPDGADEWTEIAPPDIEATAVGAGVDPDGSLVLVGNDSSTQAARLDSLDGSWIRLEIPPVPGPCVPTLYPTSAHLVAELCGSMATLTDTTWSIDLPPFDWWGVGRIVSGSGGDALFFVGQDSWAFGPPSTPEASLSVRGEWRSLPSSMSGESELSPFVAMLDENRALVLSLENGGDTVAGEVLDLEAGTAEQIAPSPLAWRAFAMVGWTGDEIVVAGGSNGPGIDVSGAAYNPETDSWRLISDPPGFVAGLSDNQAIGPGAWTGAELISWQSGLAYNPVTDSWREIAPSPLTPRMDEAVTATNGLLLVWGGCDSESVPNCDDVLQGALADGAIYDPMTDTWTMLPDGPLDGGAGSVAIATTWGDRVIVVVPHPVSADAATTAAIDPMRLEWTELPELPLEAGGRAAALTWTGSEVVIWGGYTDSYMEQTDIGFLLDPEATRWQPLERGGGARRGHSMVWTTRGLLIAGGSPSSQPVLFELASVGDP